MSFKHVSKRVILTDDAGNPYNASNPMPAKIQGALSGALNADGGISSVGNGATSVAVVFNLAFTSAPSVTAQLLLPNGSSAAIGCFADYSTLTTVGVTFLFTSATPNANYKLSWQAIGK